MTPDPRRVLPFAVALLVPFLTGLGHSGGSGGDTGSEAADDGTELCVPWEPQVQGACPESPSPALVPGARVPTELSPPRFGDGQCCWTVERWGSVPLGGCC